MSKYVILMFAAALCCFGLGGQLYAAVPTANAGPDQTVYAWIDYMATVTLDGSGSSDPNGHALSYQWTWSVDHQNYDANGVAPEIELPVGEHVITLVVSDGNNLSAPDQVVITVIEPLEVQIKFTPQTLNCKSKGNLVKAHMTLPQGFTGKDVNKRETAALEPYGLPARLIHVSSGISRKVTISFDRGTFTRALIGDSNDTAEVTAVGQLKSGQYFFGTDTIRVLNSVPKPPKDNGNGKK
jgi:hypothetical protein